MKTNILSSEGRGIIIARVLINNNTSHFIKLSKAFLKTNYYICKAEKAKEKKVLWLISQKQ